MSVSDDLAYLREVYEHEKDAGYIDLFTHLKLPPVEESMARAKEERSVTDNFSDRLRLLLEQARRPDQSFQGIFIEELKGIALKLLGTNFRELENIPVGLLPSRELNAFSMRTPMGGSVIVLNHIIKTIFGGLVQAFSSFYSWHTQEPISREFSQQQLAEFIVALARYAISLDFGTLYPYRIFLGFSSRDRYDSLYVFAGYAELFVLLHEYGHVALGHLHEHKMHSVTLPSGLAISAYNNEQIEEFEADAFAFRALIAPIQADSGMIKMSKSDAAFSVGLVLKFFELCDLIDGRTSVDHPPSAERWKSIFLLAGLKEGGTSVAEKLDSAFEVIAEAI